VSPSVPAGPPTPPATAGDVLVVDDNFGVAKALASVIGKAGFGAIPCHTGADALSYVAAGAPLAFVLDIHLPDINGLVLAQKLRERLGGEVPIIIVSGDTSMETINSLSHVGATYFFPKPINSAALVHRLKELLGR
jgi:DNA-binding response OmpR family regulator